jgi:hypothetical protein
LPCVFYGNFGRDVYSIFGTMNVDVGSPCDDVGSQLPLTCASHHINCSYQRKELEKRDHAGDHSDFVAQAPTVKPRSENSNAHPGTISKFRSSNMGFYAAMALGRARRFNCASILASAACRSAINSLSKPHHDGGKPPCRCPTDVRISNSR